MDQQVWNTLPIDLSNPVNTNHPLNQGRLAWWLTLPGWDGGVTWYDLMGLYPATLSTLGSGGNWSSSSRPGSYGDIAFNGTDGNIIDGPPEPRPTSITLATWIKLLDVSIDNLYICLINRSGGGEESGATLFFYEGEFQFWLTTNNSAWESISSGSTTINSGQWYRLVGTYDEHSGIQSFYVNGVLVGQQTNSSGASRLANRGWPCMAHWRR